jgi:RNA polymerase sigma-70 factor (ECF subfamily)
MDEHTVDVDALFAEHNTALVRYLTRLTGDSEQAQDAAQESYLRLHTRPPVHTANLRAWLFTVATNVVRDQWKKQAPVRELADAPPLALATDPQHDPHEQLERAERRQIVRRMLAKLTDRERTVLLMREEGFLHREIAEAVGTTTKSVGTMIARALRKLAGELGPAGGVLS